MFIVACFSRETRNTSATSEEVTTLAIVSAADPAPTAAIPQEEAKLATTVLLPAEKPKPAVKPRATAAKAAKPHMRRQASVTRAQSRGMFGGFFQSQPRPKPQRTTTTTR